MLQLDEELAADGLLRYTMVWVPFPAYALGRSMMFLSLDLPLSQFTATYTDSHVSNAYSKLAPFFLSLLVQGVVYTLVVLLVESSPALVNKM